MTIYVYIYDNFDAEKMPDFLFCLPKTLTSEELGGYSRFALVIVARYRWIDLRPEHCPEAEIIQVYSSNEYRADFTASNGHTGSVNAVVIYSSGREYTPLKPGTRRLKCEFDYILNNMQLPGVKIAPDVADVNKR